MNYLVQKAALAALLFMSSNSHALITPIPTKELFDATVLFLAVDSYNDLIPTPFATQDNPLPRTATSLIASYAYQASTDGAELFAAGSLGDPWLSTNDVGVSLIFGGFSNGISAAGGFFFGSNVDGSLDAGQEFWVEATNDDDESLAILHAGVDTTSFLGFLSDSPLKILKVTPVLPTVFATVNDLRLANPSPMMGVPEPGTLALIAVALVGCCFNTRRC